MLAYETEALTTEAEAETEAFEISTKARPSRGTTAPRNGLETEA